LRGGRPSEQKRQCLCLQPRRQPVAVFDKDGNLLPPGRGSSPGHASCRADDTIWLTDDGDHTVRHCTLDGRVLMTLGIPGKPSRIWRRAVPAACTHQRWSPQADILYISDGYGNARIHKYSLDGKLLLSWGEPRHDPGPVQHPAQHLLRSGRLDLVADARTHRVQVFDGNGRFETKWNDLHRRTECAWRAATTR